MNTVSKVTVACRRRLNLGCGQTRPLGWWNGDCSLNSLLQRSIFGRSLARLAGATEYIEPAHYINLNRRWPFGDGSCDVVYASHVFEHLTVGGATHFLAEARRVLAKNGVLRIVVPDLEELCRDYLLRLDAGDERAAEGLQMWMNLSLDHTYPKNLSMAKSIVARLQGYPHQHKYMYDAKLLAQRLSAAGFVKILDSSYGTSAYLPSVDEVEGTAEGVASVYIEALRD